MTRVAVFIDYQHVYKRARGAFELEAGPSTDGQIYPRRAGVLLTDRGRAVDPARELKTVHVYRGEPSAKHNPKGQAACQRQVRYWRSQACVEVTTRSLHYYYRGKDDYGNEIIEPREKGIDVCIANDMVMGANNDDFDACVLFSGDTDLLPAVESVLRQGKRCEVVAWRGPRLRSPRLRVDNIVLWCHWLDQGDYHLIHDPSDYTKRLPDEPSAEP